MQPRPSHSPEFSWAEKFRCAFRGVGLGVRGQRGFLVHAVFTVAVIGCAVGFRATLVEWCILNRMGITLGWWLDWVGGPR